MQFIETDTAPSAAGHYSQAVVSNGLVFLSGVLPIAPGGERHIPQGIEAQARQVFDNMRNILHAAGSGLDCLVNVQVFIPDIALWPSVNAIYGQMLGTHKPARTIVPCGALHYDALIEMNAVAVIKQATPER
ncbi:MAG: enamine deaminase RidA [Herminiimonas sp.]|nr:enamine deaminase RidA [Herminiimonas sp.]